ncbi:hypothetical protein ACBJ59_09275 [Nonomuraea sp. MTCD27]|uniref:hypothetical protein n=1 Tax=Nonomuraea sp. MTCD27 TaxID=1676747 RepID=UPI0035C16BBF
MIVTGAALISLILWPGRPTAPLLAAVVLLGRLGPRALAWCRMRQLAGTRQQLTASAE